MANTAVEILGALRSAIVALGDLGESEPSPYIADAAAFATQAGVCVEKHLVASGVAVPPDPTKPEPELEETSIDRDKAA